MARPKATIDWDVVGENLKTGCDATSIAVSIGIDRDTLILAAKKTIKWIFRHFRNKKERRVRTCSDRNSSRLP